MALYFFTTNRSGRSRRGGSSLLGLLLGVPLGILAGLALLLFLMPILLVLGVVGLFTGAMGLRSLRKKVGRAAGAAWPFGGPDPREQDAPRPRKKVDSRIID